MALCCLTFQIAAKIGGDGVAPPPPSNDFGFGGQKRSLEDGGECSSKRHGCETRLGLQQKAVGYLCQMCRGPSRLLNTQFKYWNSQDECHQEQVFHNLVIKLIGGWMMVKKNDLV